MTGGEDGSDHQPCSLSLDFWQDTVTYEGSTMPTGTIGCEVLNIPDSTIEKLDTPCNMLNQLLQGMNTGSVDMDAAAAGAAGRWRDHLLLQVTPPFSRLNRSYFEQKLAAIFSEEYMEDAKAYFAAYPAGAANLCFDWSAQQGNHARPNSAGAGAFELFSGAIQGGPDEICKRLNEPGYDRTSDGYAAMFGQFFKGEPTLSLDNPAWMTLTNALVQYVAAVRPGKTEPQLVKRMHYVSFVGDVPF